MKISEYFLKAVAANAFFHKEWVIELFSYCDFIESDGSGLKNYKLFHLAGDTNTLSTVIDNEVISLEGWVKDTPVARFRQELKVPANALLNVKEDITSTYGNVLVNAYIFIYPFGEKVSFKTGRIDTNKFERTLAANLLDTPTEGETRNPDKFYVDEYLKYGEAMASLEGFSMLCVQAASVNTMVPNPIVLKRRDELFLEYKDQLDDPAIIAKIQMELVKLDMSTLSEDESRDFYIKNKSWGVIRMKRFVMYGLDGGFGDQNDATLIKKSLDEGWDVEAMPAMIDSLRSGSYARGKETALGGESVKAFYRIFQNVSVSEDDCGNNHGFMYDITEEDKTRFIGLNAVKGTQYYMLTEENIAEHVGRKIELRTPMLCSTVAPNVCKVCVGETLAARPDAIHIVTSDVGSAFMGARMGAMHGKTLKTVPYDFTKAIT